MPKIEAGELLNALGEPALLVSPDGFIAEANSAAIGRAGRALNGICLGEIAGNEGLATFLTRCSRTTGTLMGAIHLPEQNTICKYRCQGKMVSVADPALILLRCGTQATDQFLLLNQRINALNDEVRNHRHTQAVLEEALRERELLVREIHHRVKNNIQIVQSILSHAASAATNAEAKAGLQDAARRMTAIASVQQALYRADQLADCPAIVFLESLVPALQRTLPASVRIGYSAEAIKLPSDIAVPMALIISELVTNSAKYGIDDSGDGSVHVRLYAAEDRLVLSVQDSGPGFVLGEIKSRASGIGLVRGLARQVGASFEVLHSNGALCIVKFPYSSK